MTVDVGRGVGDRQGSIVVSSEGGGMLLRRRVGVVCQQTSRVVSGSGSGSDSKRVCMAKYTIVLQDETMKEGERERERAAAVL